MKSHIKLWNYIIFIEDNLYINNKVIVNYSKNQAKYNLTLKLKVSYEP